MRDEAEGMEGRGLSGPPPPVAFSPTPSFSLALPTPRTLRRKEGELPGVLRGELLAVLETEQQERTEKANKIRDPQRKMVSFFIARFRKQAMVSGCRRFLRDKTKEMSLTEKGRKKNCFDMHSKKNGLCWVS